MIGQALPFAADMHIAILHPEAAHIDAVQPEKRDARGKLRAGLPSSWSNTSCTPSSAASVRLKRLRQSLKSPAISSGACGDISLCTYSTSACVCARRPGKQAEMRAQAMYSLPTHLHFAVQQATAFETVRGHILVDSLHDGKTAEDGIAVMSFVVHRIHAVCMVRPEMIG